MTEHENVQRTHPWILRAVALSLALVFAFGICEVAARLLHLGAGHSPSVGHEIYHHWHPSNDSFVAWSSPNEFGGFDNHFNAQGLSQKEDLPDNPEKSFVFLGDSFTAALEVEESNRYVTRVGEKLGVNTVNLGCTSFSPVLESLVWREFSKRLDPQAVVLQLFINDIGDDQKYLSMGKTDEAGVAVAVPGSRVSPWVKLGRKSHFVRALRRVYLTLQLTTEMEERSATPWEGNTWAPYFTKPVPDTYSKRELAVTTNHILRIKELVERKGAKFYLMVVPDRGALFEKLPDHHHRFFQDFAASKGIDFIDLYTAFERHGEGPKALYFETNIHTNARGHELIAETVAAHLSGEAASPQAALQAD